MPLAYVLVLSHHESTTSFSSLLATQITAIATAVLALFAIITAGFAMAAYRKQSGQLGVAQTQLEDQRQTNEKLSKAAEPQAQDLSESIEQRKSDADVRHRAQASRVFIWEDRVSSDPRVSQAQSAASGRPPRPVAVARVSNTSQQPVYEVFVSWHHGSALVNRWPRRPLMPDGVDEVVQEIPETVNPKTFGAVLNFRDASGTYWRTSPEGVLDEIPPGQAPDR
jgi:hypothetical protein